MNINVFEDDNMKTGLQTILEKELKRLILDDLIDAKGKDSRRPLLVVNPSVQCGKQMKPLSYDLWLWQPHYFHVFTIPSVTITHC